MDEYGFEPPTSRTLYKFSSCGSKLYHKPKAIENMYNPWSVYGGLSLVNNIDKTVVQFNLLYMGGTNAINMVATVGSIDQPETFKQLIPSKSFRPWLYNPYQTVLEVVQRAFELKLKEFVMSMMDTQTLERVMLTFNQTVTDLEKKGELDTTFTSVHVKHWHPQTK